MLINCRRTFYIHSSCSVFTVHTVRSAVGSVYKREFESCTKMADDLIMKSRNTSSKLMVRLVCSER